MVLAGEPTIPRVLKGREHIESNAGNRGVAIGFESSDKLHFQQVAESRD